MEDISYISVPTASRIFRQKLTIVYGQMQNPKDVTTTVWKKTFDEENVMAYLCNKCNYVRFYETEMDKHLVSQRSNDIESNSKKVIFLRFPKRNNLLR